MPDITPRIGLKKPLGNEVVSREDYNENLDILENVVAKKVDLESHLADYVRQPGYATTSGTSVAYTTTLTLAPTTYVEGFGITIVPHVDCGSSPTLNVNSLGAIPLLTNDGFTLSAKDLLVGKPYFFRKVGSSFFADSSGGVKVPGQKELLVKYAGAITKNDPIYISHVMDKLANADVLPSDFNANNNSMTCSDDGIYSATGSNTTPFIYFYKRTGDVLTKLANSTSLPVSNISKVAMSADGVYLTAVTHTTPFVYFYKRTGDVWAKLANPVDLPATAPTVMTMTKDGFYSCVSWNSGSTMYKRTGDVWAKITAPSMGGSTMNFSRDGLFLAYASGDSLFLVARNGDTFTSQTALAKPAPSYAVVGLNFSYDSNHLAVSTNSGSTPIITYTRSGNTFTRLVNTVNLQPPTASDIVFSPNGNYLYVGGNNLTIYKRSGTFFTKIPEPLSPPPTVVAGICTSADGGYLFVRSTSGTFLALYKTFEEARLSDGMIGQLHNQVGAGYALATGTIGTINRVMLIFN